MLILEVFIYLIFIKTLTIITVYTYIIDYIIDYFVL